ncbi:glycoside hydrolase family 88 protein [Prevotella sp.]|uniref:glycoside hydrolase family 88 protein n=2 Tax=Prevotella sp. TaxID=59823 RepID=UPI003077802F
MRISKLCSGGKGISLRHGKQLLRCLPLVGMLLATSSVNAADSPGVKFNSGVRYSQWAINSRTNDFYANTTKFGLATYKADGTKLNGRKDTKEQLDYVPGLVAKSMIEAADYYQAFDWSKPWFFTVKEYGNTYYKDVQTTGESFDNLNATKLYIGIYNNKYATDADKSNAKTALASVKTGFINANKTYVIPTGTLAEKAGNKVAGGWWHKKIYQNQMWLDGAYMGSALLAQLTQFYGASDNVFGSKKADWEMVAKQMNIVWNMCWNSTDKLMYHAFDATATATWYGLSRTTPYVFHSAAYWGRADAWYLYALVDVLEAMKADGQESTNNYTTLKSHLDELAAGIAARQDKTTGGWYQLLDKDASFKSTKYNGSSKNDANYIETSATSLFSAAFFKAVRLGLLSDSYKDVAKNAFEGLVNNFMTYDANGGIQIWGSCKSAGLGGSSYRDGSNEYYLSGSDVTMVNMGETTEGKVLGGFIMAATEYERAYQNQNQDNKQILFAKDLAPNYDFSTTAGSLDATAYGEGTPTYQWYKDGAMIADATSATYTPTESGNYYCTATVGKKTIKTSATTVTAATEGGDETPKADEGTVTFSGDDLKNYSSPMTDATKTVTITTAAGTIQKESGGDIKVGKGAAFTISVPEGKYITSITYTIKSGNNGELTFDPKGTKTTGSDGLTYTYSYSDKTLKSVKATNSANRGGIQVTSIKVTYASVSSTPTTKKYTVTATVGEGGTVAIMNGSDENVASGTEVEENTSLTFTATANDGYEFVNWTDASNGTEVNKASTYTTTVSAAINIKANFKKKEVTPSTGNESVTFAQYVLDKLDSKPGSGTSEVTTQTIGEITITAFGINGGTGRGIKMSSSDGSSFKITAANGAKIKKVIITQDRENRTLNYNPAGTESKNNSVFTYDYSSSLPKEITVSASQEGNIYVSAITVEYESSTPSTPKTDLTATFASNSVPAIVGDENINAPELTVTAGETTLVEGVGYSVSYTSDNENVVKKQEDGTMDAVGKGPATITATITPADGTKYNNKMLTFTINVSARPLKAVFSTNTVSANLSDEPRVLPKLTVTDVNLQQQVSDYTATYTSTNEGVATVVGGKLNFVGAGKTTIKVTVTPTDENTFAPCEASFDVSVADNTTTDPTKDAVVYDFKTSVGNTESANANIKVNSNNIMFGTNFKANESKYITITPNGDGGFKAGDVITLKGYCPKKNSGILIYANLTDAEPQFQSPAFADTEVEYKFTVQKDSPVLYLGRFGGSSTYVTYLNVTRPGTSGNKTRLTAAFAKNSDVIINMPDNYVIDLPELTVKAGDEVFDKYSVVYSSNDKAVATVDGNSKKITIKTPGTVTILATVTPTEANSYEGCTATYTITVKDPTPLVISTMDVMMNATDANPKQPVIKVYGDDDKLLTLNTDYTLSFEVKPATGGKTANVYIDNGTFNVNGKEYNWEEGSSVITVTATPIPDHIGNTYTEGTLDFLYNVVKGKLTPAFMNNFASGAIKIKQYDKQTNNNDKKFRVPLIYNGEDVSEYFKYTYTVKKSDGTIVTSKTTKGNEFTFRPDKEGEFTITVSAEPKTDQDNYADVYNAPAPMPLKVIVKPDFIRPVITFNPESVQMYVGTTEGAPDVTVTDGTNKIAEGNYNLRWVSFSPSYVKVDEKTGKLEAVSEGQGSVRITVTGDNLESMTAFLSVYVDDPAVYRTKSTEKYGNQRKMWNQDRTMSVTLGGWMFPNNVDKTTYSDEGLSRDYYWANEATLPKWKMTGFDRFVSGEKNKNARQENGSNAMPNTTMVSTADFQRTGTVKDAMFNVPCSGSYLTFNPKTNGTVSVHIFQNGAFDSGVYRPQRRVFVMDEQGNFVQSTPEIENANGKPTGGLKPIGNYKWDINPKGKGTAPAIEDVRSHFKNIPTDFDMTAEKFQNNIYESNLSKEIVPNDAYDEKVPGSNGWCVLADSPVTYSFKVKAGKTYYLYNFGSKIGFYGYSFDEDETKPDEISYDENSTNDVKSTEEGHVAKVSINRTFKAGVWSTCVLPFSLNMSQVDAIFGDTYRFGNENGTEILYFDRVENGKVWFVRHAYNTIVANKPFLIKPTKDVNGINTADCAEYPYVTIEAPKDGKPADWCSDGNYAWVSSYNNDMTLSKGDGYIGGTSGNFIQSTKDGVNVKGFRGFLKGLTPAAKTHVLSTMTASNTDGDGNTTFIDGLVVDGDGNFVPTATDGKVYSINGQLVGKDMKSLDSLPSGVYIINGKKYIK